MTTLLPNSTGAQLRAAESTGPGLGVQPDVPIAQSSLAELHRNELRAYVASWRSCLNSLQKSEWFAEYTASLGREETTGSTVSLLIAKQTAFGSRIFISEVKDDIDFPHREYRPLNWGFRLRRTLLSEIDLHTEVNALLKDARGRGISVPQKLNLPEPPCVTHIEQPIQRLQSPSIAPAGVRIIPSDKRGSPGALKVKLGDTWYTESRYIGNPVMYFNDKPLARAMSQHVGGLQIPRWFSNKTEQHELDRVFVPLRHIVKALDMSALHREVEANGSCRFVVADCYFDISAASQQGKYNVSLCADSLKETRRNVIVEKEYIQDEIREFVEGLGSGHGALMTPVSHADTRPDFLTSALGLGDSLYFKPDRGMQGGGIFRVKTRQDGRCTLETDCARTAVRFRELHQGRKLGDISGIHNMLFPLRHAIEEYTCMIARSLLGVGRVPQASLRVEFDDQAELKEFLTGYFAHSNTVRREYHVEEEIPLVKINERSVKVRLLFKPGTDAMLLKGHFAELGATKVTGFAAGSAQAMDTYAAFARLCAQYPEIALSPDEMFKGVVRDSLEYLSGAFQLIEEARQLDFRLHKHRLMSSAEDAYELPFAGVRGIALDIGLALDSNSKTIVPYLIESNALGLDSFGRIGIRGLWRSRPELAAAFER